MRPPPSRYKVVERGRRLEVIDTRTGEPASSVPLPNDFRRGREDSLAGAAPTPPARGSGATGAGAGIDTDTFTTARWYDDKAPRIIRLNFANRQRLLNLRWGAAIAVAMLVVLAFLFWPLAIVLVFALAAGPKLRAQIRAGVTNWIDGLDQAA